MKTRRMVPMVLALVLLIAMTACSDKGADNSKAPTIAEGSTLTISFDFERAPGSASNQFAVWIESEEGEYIKTLYATRYTAAGGYKERPESLSVWVESSQRELMSAAELETILTGPTPRTGALSYVWDITDREGNIMPPGKYRFVVEGSLRWANRVLSTGVIEVGDKPVTVQGVAEYTYESYNNNPALTEDSAENSMLGPVTATYVPGEATPTAG